MSRQGVGPARGSAMLEEANVRAVRRGAAGWALGLTAALMAAVAIVLATSATADAQFGQGFGLADSEGAAGQPSALPDEHSFWAGTCALAQAPPPDGSPLPGGVGARQPTMFRKTGPGAWVNPAGPHSDMAELDSPTTPSDCIDHGGVAQGLPAWEHPPAWRLSAVTEAGAHPDGSATFTFARQEGDPEGDCFTIECFPSTNGSVDNIWVDLPAGFVGNPQAVTECSGTAFSQRPVQCPSSSQVGVATIALINSVAGITSNAYPIYNLDPRDGKTAELGIPGVGSFTNVTVEAKARTNGDFGVATFVGQIPAALDLYTQTFTLWGVPWEAANDKWRPRQGTFGPSVDGGIRIPLDGLAPGDRAGYEPSWGPVRPFVSNPTECTGAELTTSLATDSFQAPGPFSSDGYPLLGGAPLSENWKTYTSAAPPVTDCESPAFDPAIELAPTTRRADAPTGLDVELSLPQNNDQRDAQGQVVPPPAADASEPEVQEYLDSATAHWHSPAGRATAHLDKAVVTLPRGVAVNPAGASGLAGCSDAGIGLRRDGNPPRFNDGDPFNEDGGADGAECPDASKIGTASVDTPLLEETLDGAVVLGEPRSTDPLSGEMLRLFLVLSSPERGLIAKVFGSAVADPATGQLTATFDRNPRVPFDRMSLRFKSGQRAQLAMPQDCGDASWSSTFTPWTALHGGGGQPVPQGGAFAIDGNCGFGFAPTLDAGMDTQAPRAHGTFGFTLARRDGEQWLHGLSATLPRGLLASLRDVPLCAHEQASAAACPLGSQVGIVDAKAGSGDPFVLERKGRVYLTESYKGGEYGLAVVVRPIAGPFRGGMELSPIVVRQAIHVDRKTAQVTVRSDPFPLIHHGIPLRVREIAVLVDRERFMLNPSDCSPRQVQATILSAEGAGADVAEHFQAANCASLPFRPRLAMRLVGRRQVTTGKHPAIRALVRQRGIGEAGIERAKVTLPKALALDPANAQALCEFEDGTSVEPEERCPEGSIVGRARAVSPLLNDPLVGNVYFVKNIRIDPDTGNEIRTLPMIVAALRGEIAVNLAGESSTTKGGKLVNTFANVPDAPISRFNLNIRGGRNGILAVTRTTRSEIDLCDRPRGHIARTAWRGHNGKRRFFGMRMRTPCAKRRAPAAKICRKRTDNRKALRRCVRNVRKVRAKRAKRAAARRAAERKAARRLATRG